MAGHRRHAPALVALLALALLGLAPAPASLARVTTGEVAVAAPDSVVVISVDGLNPQAIRDLGRRRAPVLHRLLRQGAGTLNARSERELTVTLPNHTGMVTGRRVDAAHHGHGVVWNDDRRRPRTVQRAAGHRVSSMFRVVHADGGRTAMFASKPKLRLLERSWPGAIDRTVVRADNEALVRRARRDLARHHRALTFIHLSAPDDAGHAHGFLTGPYLDAVARVDRWVGRLLRTARRDRDLAGRTTLVLTADHGGRGLGHGDPALPADFRVPLLAWGVGVRAGADLYEINPDYADPGNRRTRYQARRQPVRNGDVANLVTDLLGLRPVPGSEHDAAQDLDLR